MIRISASQVSTFRDCPRKWFFEKIVVLPRPEHPAAKLGQAVHAELEEFYKRGTVPKSKEALALLEIAPQPTPTLKAEDGLDFMLFPLIPARVKGFIDLRCLETVRIFDWKTTSSILKYAKTRENLETDPQALIYGLGTRLDVEALTGKQPDEVELNWMYVQTKSAKTKSPLTLPVSLTQTKMMMEVGLEAMEPVAGEMLQITKAGLTLDTQDDVPVDLRSCNKYGGCPYRSTCLAYQRGNQPPPEKEKPVDFELLKKARAALDKKPLPVIEPEVEDTPAPAPKVSQDATPEPGLPDLSTDKTLVSSPVVSKEVRPEISPEDPPAPESTPTPVPKTKASSKGKTGTQTNTKSDSEHIQCAIDHLAEVLDRAVHDKHYSKAVNVADAIVLVEDLLLTKCG